MTIHFLSCFPCNVRVPSQLRSGALCLLVGTAQGLALSRLEDDPSRYQ